MINHYRHKVVLVGDGAVGSAFAFSLLQSNREVDELVIVTRNHDKAIGDALDLADITPLTGPTDVFAGNYEDAHDADVVVITAGVPRKPGESRLDLIHKNIKILKGIVESIVASGFNGIFVISSNPVDLLTTLTQQISGFPKERVIGTGTSLDTMRLRLILSQRLNISVNAVDSQVLGEHGDSSFVTFDETIINGRPLDEIIQLTPEEKDEIEKQVRQAGAKIIQHKGATFYGVAKCLSTIVCAIVENQNTVIPVSAPLTGQYGINGLYLGSPAIINRQGIGQVVEYQLSPTELAKMQASAKQLTAVLKEVQ
ncbi:L-lactate dehydrogenase [Limosilactobacillus agrestimuris]|uniref:L-lactate dehydrogenase n=1 Tax=Limosilactobacillus agrestimuris TaxID=2941331 RepID=UPI00203C69DE|nr:L-lactate dehydrogenase [Limosilactobacillus agrestimuris]